MTTPNRPRGSGAPRAGGRARRPGFAGARKQQAGDLAYATVVMRATLEAATDGILSVNEDRRITHFNAKCQELWRIPEALLAHGEARKVWKFASEQLKDPAGFLSRIADIEASDSESFDVLERTDGRFFERYSAVLSIDGRRVGRVWSFRNVTERHQADMASRRLAAIVDSSDDAIISKDLNTTVVSWNAAAERIFGYSAAEMIGSSIMRLIPPDRQVEEQQILARIRQGERFGHFETIRIAKDGRQLSVSLTVSPIKDRAGNVTGASKIVRDITDRKATEEALKKAKEFAEAANAERQLLLEREREARAEAEKANQMKDEFLATLSHELRTPLNAILGWANILRTGAFPSEELQRGLDTIERNARVQARIIDDLLDMSRIISGKVRLEVQPVDLPLVLREAIETVRTAAEASGVRLQAVLDPVAAPVAGDPGRLQQVFWNLLSNAIKFTPGGGSVQVVLKQASSQVEVSVIDNGEGIAPDFLPYVFNRFQQADASSRRRHGGLGLGLAIVAQLVELHGGSVRAHSDGPGLGATFAVTLPLAVSRREHDLAGHGRELPARESALPPISLSNVHALVVDDEPDARQLVRRLLEGAGAVASSAGSVAEAMDQILTRKIDVLICDIALPNQDGYSLIRRVRALAETQKSGIPAVALTAYARPEDRIEAFRAGFQNHLTKPVEPAELLATVHSLARSQLRGVGGAELEGGPVVKGS
jgi:PAS domain S-box-containing protein